MNLISENIAILGGSRGLGRSLAECIIRENKNLKNLYLVSRKINVLQAFQQELEETIERSGAVGCKKTIHTLAFDLADMAGIKGLRGNPGEDGVSIVSGEGLCNQLESQSVSQSENQLEELLINFLKEGAIQTLFYVAGGGPHGNFFKKAWRDHLWAWQVSFLSIARLLFLIPKSILSIKRVVIVGSAIAESQGDPGAASYSAAKHALRGLVDSIVKEESSVEVKLFSPGYMDTDLLPQGVRNKLNQEGRLLNLDKVSRDLWAWSQIEGERHKVYWP